MEIISKDATMALCEVELIPVNESMKKEYITSQVKLVYVPLEKFNMVTSHVEVGQVFVVLHNLGRVIRVCEKDVEAMTKRKALKKQEITMLAY